MKGIATVLVIVLLPAVAAGVLADPGPALNLGSRIVPEPLETNDYLSYAEARALLAQVEQAAPDFVQILELGPSFGWDNPVTGAHDTWPVFAVEVTNELSPIPREQKRVVIAQLSIHGNEKGGREGGFRAVEDLAIPRLYGQEYRDLLDEVLVTFTFPNPDGWMHEEMPYRLACAAYFGNIDLPTRGTHGCIDSQWYVRTNGNRQDLNRDWPAPGVWETRDGREHAVSEPETQALDRYYLPFKGRVAAAIDVHGQLNPAEGNVRTACVSEDERDCVQEGHFAIGLFTGVGEPDVSYRTVRLGERFRDVLNPMAEERFPYWTNAPNAAFAGGDWFHWGVPPGGFDFFAAVGTAQSAPDTVTGAGGGTPLLGVGNTGPWFNEFLLAPGGTIELSYNHINNDNHYIPELNAMHVETVRGLVRGMLDEARTQPRLALSGAAVAYLQDDRTVPFDSAAQEGAHRNATDDDHYEVRGAATPQRLWEHLARYAPAGTFRGVTVEALERSGPGARTFVIAGDAWELLDGRPAALQALRAHVESGGRLVLTDRALAALEALDLIPAGSVEEAPAAGFVPRQDHPFMQNTWPRIAGPRGAGTLGFLPGEAAAFSVAPDALGEEGVAAVDRDGRIVAGVVPASAGEVWFVGALLTSPTNANYHPYGLADYAVSATGFPMLYNALGLTMGETEGPAETGPSAPGGPNATPNLGGVAALAVLAALAVALRKRGA